MTVSLTHAFVSTLPDDNRASTVGSTEWNEEHTLTAATEKLLGTTALSTTVTEITIGSGLTLTGSTLSAAGGGSGDMLAATYDPATIAEQLVGLTATQTLTNKTVNLASNTLTGTTAQFNTALSDGSFATLSGTETLTNKTVNLTSNTLTGTTAQFNTALSDGSFATLAGTETLTNKTIAAGSNTITVEGTSVLSTGEAGGTKFLREDGDGTCSWQTVAAGSTGWTSAGSATLSGTSSTISGIPSTAREVLISIDGASITSGTGDRLEFQIGDSGGIETTGYQSNDLTDAFKLTADNFQASSTHYSTSQLFSDDGLAWYALGVASTGSSYQPGPQGTKTLSAELSQIRLQSGAGNSFDAGTWEVWYK